MTVSTMPMFILQIVCLNNFADNKWKGYYQKKFDEDETIKIVEKEKVHIFMFQRCIIC